MFSKWVQPCKAGIASLDSWNTVGVPLSIHFPKYAAYNRGKVHCLKVNFLGKRDPRWRMFSKWVQPCKAGMASLDSWNPFIHMSYVKYLTRQLLHIQKISNRFYRCKKEPHALLLIIVVLCSLFPIIFHNSHDSHTFHSDPRMHSMPIFF